MEAIKIKHTDDSTRFTNHGTGTGRGTTNADGTTYNLKMTTRPPGWQAHLPYKIYRTQVLSWNNMNKNEDYAKFTEVLESLMTIIICSLYCCL